MAKIGIFGGSFDPVHTGHIRVAEHAMKAAGLDRVVFMPTGMPPHKMNKTFADAKDRLRMVELAIEDKEGFCVSDIEAVREKPCYSYETFGELKEIYKGDDLYFIIGTDSLLSLSKWKKPEVLSTLCTFIVVNREDSGNKDEVIAEQARLNEVYGTKSILVDIEKIDISSTDVRERIKKGLDTDSMLPCLVLDYINDKGLYR